MTRRKKVFEANEKVLSEETSRSRDMLRGRAQGLGSKIAFSPLSGLVFQTTGVTSPALVPCHRCKLELTELSAFLFFSLEAKHAILAGSYQTISLPLLSCMGKHRKTLLGPAFCELRSALPLRFRVPEPSIRFCWALEMPSAGPSAIKQRKIHFRAPSWGKCGRRLGIFNPVWPPAT